MANDSLVLHIDMDSFFVSVEQRRDARLKNRAVIIAGHSARSVVASCSYESRALGIRSGMPLSVARRLCPEALILRGDMELYSQTSAEITEMLNQHLPCLEKASIDEFYADLSGMERFFGGLSYARELREKMLEELGLPVSFGISVNKTVSKIATGQAKPNGSKAVAAGQERRFLSPLPVRAIPMAGPVITSKLEHMGIVQIESLQQIPLSWMGQAFGKPGIEIGQKARGIDNLPVTPYREQKSMSAETTFDQDLADPRELRRHLIVLTERLGQELRSQNRMCSEISVKLRYSDFQTFSKQRKIPYTCSDQQLIDHACDLMSALFVRRSRVRCIGLRLSGWITGQTTLSLFDEPSPQIHLYKTMDKLRERFGTHSILRASSLGLNNPKQSPND